MHSRPKLLLIYPHDLAESGSGVNARVSQIVKCLRAKFEMHQMGELNFESSWQQGSDRTVDLVDKVFLHDIENQGTLLSSAKRWVKKLLGRKKKTNPASDLPGEVSKSALKSFPDFAFASTYRLLDQMLADNEYVGILVSYVFWSKLVLHPKLKETKKVLLLEDFQTSQLLHRHSSLYSLGNVFEEEIKRISMFDSAICISSQEKWLFSQFCPQTKFHFVPHFLPQQTLTVPFSTQHHLVFVGSDNPFNKEAIHWFLDFVWPLLPSDTTLLVVGKVSHFVSPRKNVRLEPFLKQISEAYSNSMIAICPMLSGTGMKIKVVEALSFGRPVVCTLRALDGFPDYHRNGCMVSDHPEVFAQNITQLLTDKELYQERTRMANSYFSENFDEKKIGTDLLSIFP